MSYQCWPTVIRRWPIIEIALGECPVFAVMFSMKHMSVEQPSNIKHSSTELLSHHTTNFSRGTRSWNVFLEITSKPDGHSALDS